jgi:ABC-type glutathione transport system ATPase component
MTAPSPLLGVEDLKTYFFTRRGVSRVVDGVSFTLRAGEMRALVGELGSGTSVTSNTANTSFTLVGNSADSPEPLLRPLPAMGHDAEILEV